MKTRTLRLTLSLAVFFSWQIPSQAQFTISSRSQRGQPGTRMMKTQTDIPGGAVSGVWTREGSPYYVNGSVTVPNDSTLTIEPGVEVVLMGHYKLNVEGRLLAVGTQEDSIRFSAADTLDGWHSIRFQGTAATNDTSKIVYCVLRNGKANTGTGFDRCGGAMLIAYFDKVLVSNCLFDSNVQNDEKEVGNLRNAGAAIWVYQASPVITHSTFTRNRGSRDCSIVCNTSPGAIVSHNIFTKNTGGLVGPLVAVLGRKGDSIGDGSSSPIFTGNIIFDNVGGSGSGGISVEFGASPWIENNIIFHNKAPVGGGIMCFTNAHPVLVNNMIVFNNASNIGGGVASVAGSNPILINNILYGNRAGGVNRGNQICVGDANSSARILYCNVEGGIAEIAMPPNPVESVLYEHNIDVDPLFLFATPDDYRLSDESPCIGAGCDSVQIGAAWYHVPQFCMEGNPRPSPAGSKPDMGAYESLLGNPLSAFAYDMRISRLYARPGLDTVCVAAVLVNPLHHAAVLSAVVTDSLGAVRDSVSLSDDGLHWDGSADDNLWGCAIRAPSDESFFNVNVRAHDITQGTSRSVTNALPFTTAGPVTLDSLGITMRGTTYRLTPLMRNNGTAFTIGGAKVALICKDPWVNTISPTQYPIPDLTPGANTATRFFAVTLNTAPFPGYFNIRADVSLDGWVYWSDSIRVNVNTGVAEKNWVLPVVFALGQNHPNPFNPSTTIKFTLPNRSKVELTVFNLMGQEVIKLVEGEKEAGFHEVQFDGTHLESGVYFYRLQAGDFIQVKKFILLK
jgi:hypothetical protein